jgi:regulator of RNase E activity RraA
VSDQSALPAGVLQDESMSALDAAVTDRLRDISTATWTTLLVKRGIRNVWIRGAAPLRPGQPRIAGPAFTLRFVPAREDLATPESWSSPTSNRVAIEQMPEGCVTVVDTAGVTDAGIFGDILSARMAQKGVAALVTDGRIRDVAGVLQTGLPVWCSGVAAPPSVVGLTFVGWQEPISCGGVAVLPDDLLVVDDDGAIVVPAALVDELLDDATEQEKAEEWILEEVRRGAPLPGLYPMSAETRARYEAERSA